MNIQNKPLVSIVTVVYNAQDTIERTIKSVFSQTYKNIEYIIIDGASTDGTVELINQYANRLSYFVSESDNGIYEAMNKGVRAAKGDIIGILNADDWYNENAVEKVVNAFLASDAEIVYGDALMYYPNEPNKKVVFNDGIELEQMWWCMSIAHPATFVNSAVYEKFGLFNENFKVAGDYDFMLRCYANGIKFLKINDILVNFTDGGYSIKNFALCNTETIKINMSYISKCPCPNMVSKKNALRLENQKYRELEQELIAGGQRVYEILFPDSADQIVIWGTGKWGKTIMDYCNKSHIHIDFFIDSDLSKQNQKIADVEVLSPSALRVFNGKVLVAVKNHDTEIARQLKKMNNPNLSWILLRELLENCTAL